jgi:sugar lactone lactonase YvrE
VNATLDPLLITHDAAKNLYISDIGNNRIRRIDATTGVITTFAGTGVSGFFGDNGPATSAQFNRPVGLVFDTAGNLYVADQGNNRIRKIDTGGKITTICGTGSSASGPDGAAISTSIATPGSMAFDPSGGIVFGELNGYIIRRIDLTTLQATTIVGTANTSGYFGDGAAATSAKIGSMSGMRFDSAGNFYFIDAQNQVIRKVDTTPTHVITTVAGTGTAGFGGEGGAPLSAVFHFYNSGSPAGGMDIDSSGNIFVTDTYNQRIREINSTFTTVTTICGTGTNGYNGTLDPSAAQISNPEGIDVNAGQLVFCDTGNELVRTIGPATLSLTSGPTATPSTAGVGQTVTFKVTANLTGTTFSWDFGDGSTAGTGATVTHTYSAAGSYSATVTATNGTLTATGTVSVTVNGPLVGTGTNSTGGIFSDAFLAAFGSAPTLTNASSPLTVSGATITIKLNFSKTLSDSITISGVATVPAGFSFDGEDFTVVVGNFVQTFTLDAKGKAKLALGQISISGKTSKFTIKLSKLSLQSALSVLGLKNTTVSKVPVTLMAQVIFANTLYNISVTEHYTAKQGKTGSTSK